MKIDNIILKYPINILAEGLRYTGVADFKIGESEVANIDYDVATQSVSFTYRSGYVVCTHASNLKRFTFTFVPDQVEAQKKGNKQ